MARKTTYVTRDVIASNDQWRLIYNVNRTNLVTWIIAKKKDRRGQPSGYVEVYADEAQAFSECAKRGLKIDVRKS